LVPPLIKLIFPPPGTVTGKVDVARTAAVAGKIDIAVSAVTDNINVPACAACVRL